MARSQPIDMKYGRYDEDEENNGSDGKKAAKITHRRKRVSENDECGATPQQHAKENDETLQQPTIPMSPSDEILNIIAQCNTPAAFKPQNYRNSKQQTRQEPREPEGVTLYYYNEEPTNEEAHLVVEFKYMKPKENQPFITLVSPDKKSSDLCKRDQGIPNTDDIKKLGTYKKLEKLFPNQMKEIEFCLGDNNSSNNNKYKSSNIKNDTKDAKLKIQDISKQLNGPRNKFIRRQNIIKHTKTTTTISLVTPNCPKNTNINNESVTLKPKPVTSERKRDHWTLKPKIKIHSIKILKPPYTIANNGSGYITPESTRITTRGKRDRLILKPNIKKRSIRILKPKIVPCSQNSTSNNYIPKTILTNLAEPRNILKYKLAQKVNASLKSKQELRRPVSILKRPPIVQLEKNKKELLQNKDKQQEKSTDLKREEQFSCPKSLTEFLAKIDSYCENYTKEDSDIINSDEFLKPKDPRPIIKTCFQNSLTNLMAELEKYRVTPPIDCKQIDSDEFLKPVKRVTFKKSRARYTSSK